MMFIVKPLKIFTLPFQGAIAWKPLLPEKLFVVGVIETFNSTVSPRFANWNEYRLNAKMQTEPYYHTE